MDKGQIEVQIDKNRRPIILAETSAILTFFLNETVWDQTLGTAWRVKVKGQRKEQ